MKLLLTCIMKITFFVNIMEYFGLIMLEKKGVEVRYNFNTSESCLFKENIKKENELAIIEEYDLW